MVVPLLDEAAAGTSPARSELMVANSVKEDGGVCRYHHQSGIEETFTLVALEGSVALEVQTVVERAAADGAATARRSGGGDVTGEI
ncbi:hypothetical protein F2Q68_00034907 [Brassica cretica]|uniref:Uncharacterized protein n=1 Tax=Brassica cretica TaxID=69181 RepID=A0A8S9H536_BRACR|nr:hypothetical protein F2Q68_00034907 [Brassica cretica]